MKITKKYLQKMIKEEITRALDEFVTGNEGPADPKYPKDLERTLRRLDIIAGQLSEIAIEDLGFSGPESVDENNPVDNFAYDVETMATQLDKKVNSVYKSIYGK